MTAVLEATVELLAEAGPHALSVRQVAERAGVNHALVHRHFGTKEAIVRRALQVQSAAIADEIRSRSQDGGPAVVHALAVLAEHPGYWTTLARVALDDPGLAGEGTAPTTELFATAMGEQGGDLGTTGAAACLMLGWRVFADFVVGATGVPREELDVKVSALMHTLLRG